MDAKACFCIRSHIYANECGLHGMHALFARITYAKGSIFCEAGGRFRLEWFLPGLYLRPGGFLSSGQVEDNYAAESNEALDVCCSPGREVLEIKMKRSPGSAKKA